MQCHLHIIKLVALRLFTVKVFASISGKCKGDRCSINSKLMKGNFILSPSGNMKLLMQEDDDLAICCKDKQIWSAMSFGDDIDGLYLYDDGSLAVVRNYRSFVWSTDTYVTPNKPTVLTILDEGNLILSTTSDQVVWDTLSCGKCHTGKRTWKFLICYYSRLFR